MDITTLVCKKFCRFFKEGKKEKVVCGGIQAVEAAIKSKWLTEAELRDLPCIATIDPHSDKMLYDWVCTYCAFLADGCDYRDENAPAPKYPCGGFLVLISLLEKRGSLP